MEGCDAFVASSNTVKLERDAEINLSCLEMFLISSLEPRQLLNHIVQEWFLAQMSWQLSQEIQVQW